MLNNSVLLMFSGIVVLNWNSYSPAGISSTRQKQCNKYKIFIVLLDNKNSKEELIMKPNRGNADSNLSIRLENLRS